MALQGAKKRYEDKLNVLVSSISDPYAASSGIYEIRIWVARHCTVKPNGRLYRSRGSAVVEAIPVLGSMGREWGVGESAEPGKYRSGYVMPSSVCDIKFIWHHQ